MSTLNLDDPKKISQIDQSNMLGVIEDFPEQCRSATKILEEISLPPRPSEIDSVIILGMGGSGIGGNILEVFLRDELAIPLVVNKSYTIPNFVNQKTLVFASSYSGNTEETLSGFEKALERGAKVIVVTSGGTLFQRAQEEGLPVLKIASGYQPRAALGYLFFPILGVLQRWELISDKTQPIEETFNLLEHLSVEFSSRTSQSENLAKQTAANLSGKIPVIYGSDDLTGVAALRWKCQFNENSKVPAFWHILPELNHNEIVGWDAQDFGRNFAVIFLRSQAEYPKINKRMEITRELIEKQVGGVYQIWARGDSRLAKIFSLIYLGDFISAYLAILYQINPTPIERIEVLKERLKQG